jgi:hypothetical protein
VRTRALNFSAGADQRDDVMELLTIAGIILTASILESLFGVVFGRRRPKEVTEAPLDNLTERRYSRLGSEYETPGADQAV